jgi:hypothetical protein
MSGRGTRRHGERSQARSRSITVRSNALLGCSTPALDLNDAAFYLEHCTLHIALHQGGLDTEHRNGCAVHDGVSTLIVALSPTVRATVYLND